MVFFKIFNFNSKHEYENLIVTFFQLDCHYYIKYPLNYVQKLFDYLYQKPDQAKRIFHYKYFRSCNWDGNINPDIFFYALFLSLIIAFLTVTFQAVKSAIKKPVEAIKWE